MHRWDIFQMGGHWPPKPTVTTYKSIFHGGGVLFVVERCFKWTGNFRKHQETSKKRAIVHRTWQGFDNTWWNVEVERCWEVVWQVRSWLNQRCLLPNELVKTGGPRTGVSFRFYPKTKDRSEKVMLTKESCRTATWKGRFWKQSSRILLKLLILIESIRPFFSNFGPRESCFGPDFFQKKTEKQSQKMWSFAAVFNDFHFHQKNINQKGGWLNTFCKVFGPRKPTESPSPISWVNHLKTGDLRNDVMLVS